jgi:hypothetical protein
MDLGDYEIRFRFTGENTILMIRSCVVLACLAVLYWGCAPKYQRFVGGYQFSNNGHPNYESLDYWAAHPAKQDSSDSIPAPLQKEYFLDSTVDVFFVHPTTFTDTKDERWNAEIDDASLNAKTDFSTILYQASVFNQARVFAPRYRQANLRVFFTKDTTSAIKAFELAYEDIRLSFQYYLDHLNQGRPIIIASHSQGSSHAIRLLKDFFDDKPLQEKLIVAYVVGMNIPLNVFQQLKPCLDSAATGCFCSWRTFKRGHEPSMLSRYKESYVTNPLIWTTTNSLADRSLNKGGVLRHFDQLILHTTDAQIHNSILWSSRPKFPGSFLYRSKNYHIGDINLFYVNIRKNMQDRISAYRSRNPNTN